MARMVHCIKLGREAEGLDFPPYPGELGKRIYENVSKEAWAQWVKHQTMLVNENRLSLADPRARKYLAEQMEPNVFSYCIVPHGAILRRDAKNPLIADQVAANYRKADITERQKAMLEFALKVALRAAELTEADYAKVRAHGFSDEDIWDIGAIAAFFALSNRMANLIDMRPNDEFHLLGRVPKA